MWKPLSVLAIVLASCAEAPPPETRTDAFFANLSVLCDRAARGGVVTDDPRDAAWQGQEMVVGPGTCDADTISVPVVVGEDASRRWDIRRIDGGLQLVHHHVHADGSPDAVTEYGGITREAGRATAQAFPADERSKALFVREGIPDSARNTWRLEVDPEAGTFAYGMSRPEPDGLRDFRAEMVIDPR